MYNTGNPIGSTAPKDFSDNSEITDRYVNDVVNETTQDRFGRSRLTIHGLEQKAKLDIADAAHDAAAEATEEANAARDQAIAAKLAAMNAAASSGVTKYADTKAILTAGVGTTYVNGDVVLVFADESQSGASAIYKIDANAAVFKTLFDQTRADLLSFTGNISADAEWSDVPAHSDPAFDVQAQALADRTQALSSLIINARVDVTSFPFFADKTKSTASDVAVNAAKDFVMSMGGGTVYLPAGDYLFENPVILDTGVTFQGAGFGVTRVWVAPGANCDAFKSRDFDALTGVGPITSAPHHCRVLDITIYGNYLDLGATSEEISWRDSDFVLNHSGCGIKSFATCCEYKVEVFNVADNAIYSEAIGTQFANSTSGLRLWLDGRISGQEAVVMRGPGDSSIDFIGFGLCGILPKSQRATTTSLASKLYPTDQVNGVVIDNAGVYEGHCEITRLHTYAVSFGYGFKTLGTCRLNALHLAVDNSRGGYDFSSSTHGLVAMAEARAIGRNPADYSGSGVAPLPDLLLQNGGIWSLDITLKSARYSPSRDDDNYAIQITGSNNIVKVTRHGQYISSTGKAIKSPFISVSGDNNVVQFTCKRNTGNVVRVTGGNNNIVGTCSQIWDGAVFVRDTTGSGKPCFGNTVSINAEQIQASSTLFNSVGVAASERITLMGSGVSGYTKFTGDAPVSLNRVQMWDIAALDGSSVNGKTTSDYVEAVIPNNVLSGTIVVPHNFLYTPALAQVGYGFRYPGAIADAYLNIGLVSADAENLTFAYRWSVIPTTGAATLVAHIR